MKRSEMVLVSFCWYWEDLQNNIALKGRVIWRKKFDFNAHCEEVEDQFFRRLYRISKRQMRLLSAIIYDDCRRTQMRKNSKIPAITVETMLCVSMRFLAGTSYLDVSWPYGISVPSVYNIFEEVLFALDAGLNNIKFPTTEGECRKESDLFISKRKTPIHGIIAALDGLAVAIEKPKSAEVSDPKKYRNRKNFLAVVVQAAVTADYKFVFVSATHAGGTHDSTAYQASALHTLVNSGKLPRWAVIVADDAYQNTLNVVTPYSGRNLSNDRDGFNFFHSSCRITVEQVFGMWVSRFGIYWRYMKVRLEKITLIIGVTCKLHNFIIDHSERDEFSEIPLHCENDVQGTPDVYLQNDLHTGNVNRGRRTASVINFNNRRDRIRGELYANGYMRPTL